MVGTTVQSAVAKLDPSGSSRVAAAIPLEVVRAVVDAGRWAPSGDNCQPWRFTWDGQRVRVRFLAERAEAFYDVHNFASWISLGAVLTNMAIAARHFGWKVIGDLFPPAEPSSIVAVGRFERSRSAGDPLFPAITRRCVNRRPYQTATLPETLWIEFDGHASLVGEVNLAWVEDNPAKADLAAVAAENERLVFEHPALHADLYRWIRWTFEEVARAADGLPVAALELGRLERHLFRWLGSSGGASALSRLGLGWLPSRRSRQVYARSGAIAVLSVAGRQPADFVRVGEVLQRIWLTATLRGIALQPMAGLSLLLLRATLAGGEGLSRDQQRHLQGLATRLRKIVPLPAKDLPAMIFRIGYARAPSARAPRLALDEVFAVTPG